MKSRFERGDYLSGGRLGVGARAKVGERESVCV